jgi:hypothetical protein
MRLVVHVAPTGDRKCSYRILVSRPEGKGPLGSSRHRWDDNINYPEEDHINYPEENLNIKMGLQ